MTKKRSMSSTTTADEEKKKETLEIGEKFQKRKVRRTIVTDKRDGGPRPQKMERKP